MRGGILKTNASGIVSCIYSASSSILTHEMNKLEVHTKGLAVVVDQCGKITAVKIPAYTVCHLGGKTLPQVLTAVITAHAGLRGQ